MNRQSIKRSKTRPSLIIDSDESETIDDVDLDPDYGISSDNEDNSPEVISENNSEENIQPVDELVPIEPGGEPIASVIEDHLEPLNNIEELSTAEEPTQNKSRKRQRYPEKNKSNIAKLLRNSGKSYINLSSKQIKEKTFIDVPCTCKNSCKDKITTVERQSMFEKFWLIGNFKQQNAFICGLIQRNEIKHRRPRKEGGVLRSGSNMYFLKAGQGLSINVCKKYFLNTFSVSDGRITRALLKVSQGKKPGEDLRGFKGCPSRKISNEVVMTICKHIESFPSYQSHYTRNHNENQKYLSEMLNIRKMYKLYVESCAVENRTPVKENFYRHIFNSKYNLHFKIPHKDSCKKCDIYKIKISNPDITDQDRSCVETEHEIHLLKAEAARKSMKDDKESAISNPEDYACSMDLQKALPFPVLTVSDAYYKRNLYVYNFGVHDLTTDSGIFYVWDETIASRGSQEISSCLVKHLKLHASDKKKITIYSDTCTGQNRNIKMSLALMKFLQSNETEIEVIEQKFLVSGHSFLPNDSDFGSVEQAAKGKLIYTPDQWYEIMASARHRKKFLIYRMQPEDFHSTTALENIITKRKKNEDNFAVNWFNMQWMRYTKIHPYKIFYKETLQNLMDFQVLNLKPGNKKGRPPLLQNIPAERLYLTKRPVTDLKKKDMMDLLPFIPPVYHSFFQNLSTTDDETENNVLLNLLDEE